MAGPPRSAAWPPRLLRGPQVLAEQDRRWIQDLLRNARVQPQAVDEIEVLELAFATRHVAELFRRRQDGAVFVQQERQILLDLDRQRDGAGDVGAGGVPRHAA